MNIHKDFHDKLIEDFHGNEIIFSKEYEGILPKLDIKAQLYITNLLKNNEYFRIAIIGGGCAGFQYNFSIEKNIEDEFTDIVFSTDPKAVTDDISIKYLYGATIKWEENILGSKLVVDNPGIKQNCGCGLSFGV